MPETLKKMDAQRDWAEIWTGRQHNRAADSDDFAAATGKVGGLVL